MARPILQLEATEEEVLELSRLARGSKVSVRDRFRANIILLRLEGKSETEVTSALGCSLGAVCKWSKRFDREGIVGLKDAPGRGRKALLPSERISLIVERATRPAQGRIRWSVRTMARAQGISRMAVQRIWTQHNLKPHLVKTFKLSRDPQFASKIRAVVGLYVDPPAHAVVLSVDEKSQIQALDRSAPVLPLLPHATNSRRPSAETLTLVLRLSPYSLTSSSSSG